jgi:hypothetical protein
LASPLPVASAVEAAGGEGRGARRARATFNRGRREGGKGEMSVGERRGVFRVWATYRHTYRNCNRKKVVRLPASATSDAYIIL